MFRSSLRLFALGWCLAVSRAQDSPRPDLLQADPAERTRTLTVEERFLHLPVKNGARMRRMKFVVGGAVVREFDIELADEEPDFLVFADVAAFRGEELRIEVDAISARFAGIAVDRAERRRARRGGDVPGAPASSVPLLVTARVEQRSQWARVSRR